MREPSLLDLDHFGSGPGRDTGNIRGRRALRRQLAEDGDPVDASRFAQPVRLVVDLKSFRRRDRHLECGGEVSGRCVDDHLVAQVARLDGLALGEGVGAAKNSVARVGVVRSEERRVGKECRL